jgi:carbon storage regulator
MLVLTRRSGEAVLVGEISVKVLRIHCGRVRLGFSGPPEISIARSEIRQTRTSPASPCAAEASECEGRVSPDPLPTSLVSIR